MKAAVRSGADRIGEFETLFRGRRIGLMTNPTGIDRELRPTIDLLHARFGLSVLLACEDKELNERIFELAREIKQTFYGNRIVIFAPLYLFYCWYMARRNADNIGHTAHFWGAVYGIVFPLVLKPEMINYFFSQLGL